MCEVVSHCVFDLHFTARNVEHFFMYLLAICTSLVLVLCLFYLNYFGFLLLNCVSSWFILDIYWRYHVQISSPFDWLFFIWLVVSFRVQKLLVWCGLIHFFLFYCPCLWGQVHKGPSDTKILKFSACAFFYLSYCFRAYIRVFNPFWVSFLCNVWSSHLKKKKEHAMWDVTKSDIKGFSCQVVELVTGGKKSFGIGGFPDLVWFCLGWSQLLPMLS